MSDNNSKAYMELQMEELKSMVGAGVGVPSAPRDPQSRSGRPQDREIAELYADAAEYEAELERLEGELEVIRTMPTATMAGVLDETFPEETQDYARELGTVVATGWTREVEAGRRSDAELEIVGTTLFPELTQTLCSAFPDHPGDFESEIKTQLIRRWELYIEIKKEHIKEETTHIKNLGLKPHFAKKVYKRYHGIA